MDAAGAIELLMPALQPVELWKESGRYETFGDLLMKLTISGGHQMALGPTHEEVVTDLVRDLIRSYKQLPITLYQIQTKFRDEPRPRFGIVRTREFLMKDAYSFDADVDQLNASYDAMYEAYCRIFDRCGLPYVDRRGRERPDRRRQLARVHGPLLDRRGHGHPVPEVRLRGQPGAGRGRRPATPPPTPDPRPPALPRRSPTPEQADDPARSATSSRSTESTSAKLLVFLADGKPVAALIRGDHEANEAKVRRAFGATTLVAGRRRRRSRRPPAPRWASSGRSAIKIPLVDRPRGRRDADGRRRRQRGRRPPQGRRPRPRLPARPRPRPPQRRRGRPLPPLRRRRWS